MSRRQKSQEIALFESITGLIGVGGFLYLLSPGFRSAIQTILMVAVITVLIGLAVWLLVKLFKNEPSAAYKAIYAETGKARNPYHYKPPVIEISPSPVRPVPEPTISEKLRKIDWFQFEKLIEMIYRHCGFAVERSGGANPDGGVDMVVTSAAEKFVVQCKHWRTWKVGVKEIREFLGALTDTGIKRGVFITSNSYTGDARQLAAKHGIEILDKSDLIRMLEKTGLMYSQEVSELIF